MVFPLPSAAERKRMVKHLTERYGEPVRVVFVRNPFENDGGKLRGMEVLAVGDGRLISMLFFDSVAPSLVALEQFELAVRA